MRLAVPFYENRNNDCGPVALRMVLAYFGEERTIAEIGALALSHDIGVTMTVGLAKAAAELGFSAELFTAMIAFNPEHLKEQFYQDHGGASAAERMDRILKRCYALGVRVEERTLTREEVFVKMDEDCIPIILFDWNRIVGKNGFNGHFMVMVGYDESHVYLHQPGPEDPTPLFRITHHQFDEARRAKGTDEDILFIHRKTGNEG